MVDAVADHVHERLAELVDDGLVHTGVLAFEDQLHVLALLSGQVAHQTGKALEDVPDGEHPDVHDRLLELPAHPGDLVDRLEHLAARLVRDEHGGEVLRGLLELGAVDDQLADQVQEVIELGEVDAHHARPDGSLGLGSALLAAGDLEEGRRGDGGLRGGGRGGRERRSRTRVTNRDGARPAAQELLQGLTLGEKIGAFAPRHRRMLDAIAQGRGAREELVEQGGLENEPLVANAGEHVLEPMHVVLDPVEAHHPAVPLEGVQRAEDRRRRLRGRARRAPGPGGHGPGPRDAPAHPRGRCSKARARPGTPWSAPRAPDYPAVIFSMRPWSSEAWKGFFT